MVLVWWSVYCADERCTCLMVCAYRLSSICSQVGDNEVGACGTWICFCWCSCLCVSEAENGLFFKGFYWYVKCCLLNIEWIELEDVSACRCYTLGEISPCYGRIWCYNWVLCFVGISNGLIVHCFDPIFWCILVLTLYRDVVSSPITHNPSFLLFDLFLI